MGVHIEWVHADHSRPAIVPPKEIEEISDDGNEARDWGLQMIGDDGAMLHGSLESIARWLEQAQAAIEEPLRKERNKAIKARRMAAGEPKCEHAWVLTEDGYSRTWSTEIREDGAIKAYYQGSSDFGDEGSGEYLECGICGHVKPVGGTPILWDGVEA